jgi:hypothetical protein
MDEDVTEGFHLSDRGDLWLCVVRSVTARAQPFPLDVHRQVEDLDTPAEATESHRNAGPVGTEGCEPSGRE